MEVRLSAVQMESLGLTEKQFQDVENSAIQKPLIKSIRYI